MTQTTNMRAGEDALLAVLTGAGLPAGVPVELGIPVAPAATHVWIGEITEGTWEPDTSAPTDPAYTETIDYQVGVITFLAGNDFAGARDAAYALVDLITVAIGANRTLGGAVDDAYVTRLERDSGANDAGRFVQVLVTVHTWATVA